MAEIVAEFPSTAPTVRYSVLLASADWTDAPELLPPIDPSVPATLSIGTGDPSGDAHFLPAQIWRAKFKVRVDAAIAFGNLERELSLWPRKAYRQPVADGWQWHLQFHDVLVAEPEGITRRAHLRGFAVPIPPNVPPPTTHTFTNELLQPPLCGPWVTVRVDTLDERRALVFLTAYTGAGLSVAKTLFRWIAANYGDSPAERTKGKAGRKPDPHYLAAYEREQGGMPADKSFDKFCDDAHIPESGRDAVRGAYDAAMRRMRRHPTK